MDIIVGGALVFATITFMCLVFSLKLPQEKMRMYFFILTLLSAMGGLVFMLNAPNITDAGTVSHANLTSDGLSWAENSTINIVMPEAAAGPINGIYMILLATLVFIFALVIIMLICEMLNIFEKLRARW